MILMVGATGALGGVVTRDLISRGHAVRVLVRPGSEYTPLVEVGALPVMGDLKDPQSLARACAGATTVITTANSAHRAAPDTVEAVDRRGNRALIDAAAAAGVDHFIFVSALGVSATSQSDFFRAKAETEAHLRQTGMAWTIVQPDIFMEVWIGIMIGIPVARGEPVTLFGSGDHRHAMISMHDAAGFVAAAAVNPAARNRTLPVGGPEPCTWTQVAHMAESVLGRSLDVRYVAPGTALAGRPPMAAQLGAVLETYETVIDTQPLATEFGIRLTTIEECLGRMLHLDA